MYIVGHSSDDSKSVIDAMVSVGANEFEIKPTSVENVKSIV